MKQNAVDFILKNIDIIKLLKYYGVDKYYESPNKEYIRCKCPIHHGNNPTAFVLNTKNKLWYCHSDCQNGGTIFDLVEKLENISFLQAVNKIAEIMNINISNMEIVKSQKYVDDTKKWIDMMKSKIYMKEKTEYDISQLEPLYNINSYRNFNKITLNHFGVKFCESNKRVVVPIYQNNKCVGVTMRSTNKSIPKWLHQPKDILVSNYLYNIDTVQNTLEYGIMLVEGVGDVWNAWQCGYDNAVSTFGCHLTKQQLKILITKTYYIILGYDGDYAGIQGNFKAYEMLKNTMKINVANIPLNKDIGELTLKEFNDVMGNLLSFNEWSKQQHIKDILNNMSREEWNKKWLSKI